MTQKQKKVKRWHRWSEVEYVNALYLSKYPPP